ncbi:MAG: helix-turn-helix domain-containing protein [Rhodospirillales bacterium]|nr:helix-turn-helix domain-containing protein [Rhodospirillales bacterium]
MPKTNDKRQHAAASAPPVNATVGQLLRAERTRRGWQTTDIAKHLKIRRALLEAIETGRHQDLPRGAYAIGFVRSYADLLELDSAELIRRFKEESTGIDEPTELTFPTPINESRLPGRLVVAFSLLLAVGAYGGWYYSTLDQRAPAPRVTAVPETLAARIPAPEPAAPRTIAPSSSEALARSLPSAPAPAAVEAPAPLPPAAFVPTPAPAQLASLPVAPPAPSPSAVTEGPRSYGEASEGRIVIRATSDSWTQVRDASGGVIFSRILRAGETYNAPDRDGLTMSTGNAGGLDIRVDGKAAPAVGRLGFVQRSVSLDPQRLLAGTAINEAAPLRPAAPAAAPAAPAETGEERASPG